MPTSHPEPEFQRIQSDFHRRADVRRLRNRLQNPYIRTRERRLFAGVLKALGPGCRRILEIGCGEGSNYVYLKGPLPDVEYVGLDFSLAKVKQMTCSFPESRAVCADAVHLPFADACFDAVLCRDLLHHVNFARDSVVVEALRVVRPGGRLLVLEANGGTLLNRVFRLLRPAEKGMKDSSPDKLQRQLALHGPTDLQFVEPSQLVRALGYFFGWPAGPAKIMLAPLYAVADLYERLAARMIPRSRWAVMSLCIERRCGSLKHPHMILRRQEAEENAGRAEEAKENAQAGPEGGR